jgi:DNA-directed RNA polymerase subunit F
MSTTDTIKLIEIQEILIEGQDPITIEFHDLFPPKTLEEYRILKDDIDARKGIIDKVVVWTEKRILLDGHHRAQIHMELGLEKPLEIEWQSFTSEEEAKMWMLQHQVIRRNLKTFQRVEAVLKLNKFYAEMAKKNQKTSGKPLTQKFGEGGEVNEILGKLVNVSPETVRKVKRILGNKKNKKIAEGIKALRKGDPNVSIHSVYLMCLGKESPKTEPQLSKGLKTRVKDTLKHFATLTDNFSNNKEDGIYICNEMIEWARGKKTELNAPQNPRKKAIKKPSKK